MVGLKELEKYKHIHMIGIGGSSMSGIAEFIKNWGIKVTGSDMSASAITDKLISHDIPITIGSDITNALACNLIVYSAAISLDNPELLEARAHHIPSMERADFLGIITKAFQDTICVSGTHGKSTTTSMLSLCFIEANLDPTIQIGAELKQIDGNYKVGSSQYFILEACEYVESFLKFSPKSEIILNIDNDHLDYFKNLDNVKNAFIKYVKLLPEDGVLVYNGDDENCSCLAPNTKANCVSYGIENMQADFVAKNITFNQNGFPIFDVYYKGELYQHFELAIPGKHNVLNSLACIALCDAYHINKEDIRNALKKYTGVHRRFEYIGTFDQDVHIFDDYGHHPTEIRAVYEALKQKQYNESWIVFQPHTYSRTTNLLSEFAESLKNYDHIVITDIYAAREKNIYNIHAKDLVDKLNEIGVNAVYISDFGDIVSYIKNDVKPHDIILTQGAGTITNLGQMFIA